MTKYARFLAHGEVAYGVVEGDTVKQITAAPYEDHEVTDHSHTLDEVKLLAPVVPNKVVAIGLNYRSHLGDRTPPSVPEPFFKTTSSVVGPWRRRYHTERGARRGRHGAAGGGAFAGHRKEGQAGVQRGRAGLYPGLHLRQRHERAKLAGERSVLVEGEVFGHLHAARAVHRIGAGSVRRFG